VTVCVELKQLRLILKIAYFINQYPKVSHSFIRREILAMERQGFEIQRIALRGWKESLPDAEDRQEQEKTQYVLRTGLRGLLVPLLLGLLRSPLKMYAAFRLAIRVSRQTDGRLLHHLVCVAEASRILIWIARSRACHLHAHFGTNSAEIAMQIRVLGGPTFSFTVHGPDEFLAPLGLEDKISRSAFVVAISSFGRSQLYLRTSAALWRKIRVVHCALEPSFYSENTSTQISDSRLVCIGRLCEAKGQLLLIDAVARLKQRGVHVDLILAGDGPMRAEIEKRVREFGLQDRVRITGWISSDRVREEILAARAMVLPSFAEGLPVVIMEAFALRRPVITTYVAGIPELVKGGENGWLIPAGSICALTAAMEDCLSRSSDEIQRMGDAGRRIVIERHSIDVEAGKLANHIRGVDSSCA
jgi:colanic acid/amylovoran biosynthesis glycosyltransferase